MSVYATLGTAGGAVRYKDGGRMSFPRRNLRHDLSLLLLALRRLYRTLPSRQLIQDRRMDNSQRLNPGKTKLSQANLRSTSRSGRAQEQPAGHDRQIYSICATDYPGAWHSLLPVD